MRAQPVRARCISTLTQITLSSERALAAVNSVTEAARGVAFVQKSAPRAEDAAGGSDPQRGGDAPSSRTFGLPVGPRSHPAHFVSRQAKSLSLRVGGREAMRLPGSEPIRSTGDAFLNMVSEQREAQSSTENMTITEYQQVLDRDRRPIKGRGGDDRWTACSARRRRCVQCRAPYSS